MFEYERRHHSEFANGEFAGTVEEFGRTDVVIRILGVVGGRGAMVGVGTGVSVAGAAVTVDTSEVGVG